MSDLEREDEEGPREDEPNPTQEAMGEGEDRPVDVSWREDELPEESPLA